MSVLADYNLGILLIWMGDLIFSNSWAHGKFEWNFMYVIFKQILMIDGWGIDCEIAQIRISLEFTDDQSTSVQVMAWCCWATSYCLIQCWPRSLSPYGVTRPEWVNWCYCISFRRCSSSHSCILLRQLNVDRIWEQYWIHAILMHTELFLCNL